MILVLTLIVALVSSAGLMAFARHSITNEKTKPVVPDSGIWSDGGFVIDEDWEGLVSVDPQTDKYKSKETAEVVEKVNGGANVKVEEVINYVPQPENKQNAESFPTTQGYDVNLKLYDRITDFYEIKYHKDGANNAVEPGEVTIEVPECVGMKGSDLMVLVLDSKTGEMYMIPLSEFDSETGTLKVDLPCTGAYCVCHKIPIVVRNVDPDRYPNKTLTKMIKSLPDDEVIECVDFLKHTGVKDTAQLEVDDNVFINPEDYSSAIALSDVAVKVGREDFDYDLTTRFKANLFRANDKVDWERILKYAGESYDKDDIIKDDKLLTEYEPIKLDDCFVYHIDAVTREVSIIYEPTICWDTYGHLTEQKSEDLSKDAVQYFDVDDIDPQNIEERKLKLEKEDENQSGLVKGLVDEVYADTDELTVDTNTGEFDKDDVCIVLNGDEYLGMGPFLLFMPKHYFNFPWWILLVVAALVGGYIYYRKRKNKEQEA